MAKPRKRLFSHIFLAETGLAGDPNEAPKETLDFAPGRSTIKVSPPIQSGSNGPLAEEESPLLSWRPVYFAPVEFALPNLAGSWQNLRGRVDAIPHPLRTHFEDRR